MKTGLEFDSPALLQPMHKIAAFFVIVALFFQIWPDEGFQEAMSDLDDYLDE